MAITDKTRKRLWGRSGNRCARCRHELVEDATAVDDESVVGEECHVISPRFNGPRHDPSYPQEKLDSQENLILLCRVDHKIIDDQYGSYTVDILRQMKATHEEWVSQKLVDKPLKIRSLNPPDYLKRLTTGKEILNILTHAYALKTRSDELKSQEEVDLVDSFLQCMRDLLDIPEYIGEQEAFDLTRSLEELECAGFFVFGAREVALLEGGIGSDLDFPIAILRVLRADTLRVQEYLREKRNEAGH